VHVGGYDPWEDLRQRPHIQFGLADLPDRLGGGVWWPTDDGGALVVLDRRLDQAGRRAVLTHELVHDEQGGACPSHPWAPRGWGAVVCRHENNVNAEVARRLVPLDVLERWCQARAESGIPTSAGDVAEEFEVPVDVARRALRQICPEAA
jgi:hypothetical protein